MFSLSKLLISKTLLVIASVSLFMAPLSPCCQSLLTDWICLRTAIIIWYTLLDFVWDKYRGSNVQFIEIVHCTCNLLNVWTKDSFLVVVTILCSLEDLFECCLCVFSICNINLVDPPPLSPLTRTQR